MGFLSNLLKQAEAQVNPWDNGQTAATVRQQQQRPQAAQLPSPGQRPPTNRANREYNSGAEQLQMPHLSNPIPSLHNFATQSFAQLNPLDGGRTWKQVTPTNTGSVLQQVQNSGLGHIAAPVASLGKGIVTSGAKTAGAPLELARAGVAHMTGNQPAQSAAIGRLKTDASAAVGLARAVPDMAYQLGESVNPVGGDVYNRSHTFTNPVAKAVFGSAPLPSMQTQYKQDVAQHGKGYAMSAAATTAIMDALGAKGAAVKAEPMLRTAGKASVDLAKKQATTMNELAHGVKNPHPDVSPEDYMSLRRVTNHAQGGPEIDRPVSAGDLVATRSLLKQKGYDPNDLSAADHIVNQISGYEAKKQAIQGGYVQDPFRAAMDKSKQLVGQYTRVANQGEQLANQVDRAHNIAHKGNGTSSEQMALGKFMDQRLGLKSLNEGGFINVPGGKTHLNRNGKPTVISKGADAAKAMLGDTQAPEAALIPHDLPSEFHRIDNPSGKANHEALDRWGPERSTGGWGTGLYVNLKQQAMRDGQQGTRTTIKNTLENPLVIHGQARTNNVNMFGRHLAAAVKTGDLTKVKQAAEAANIKWDPELATQAINRTKQELNGLDMGTDHAALANVDQPINHYMKALGHDGIVNKAVDDHTAGTVIFRGTKAYAQATKGMNKPPLPKELHPLAEEAKKYGSAEQFAKREITLPLKSIKPDRNDTVLAKHEPSKSEGPILVRPLTKDSHVLRGDKHKVGDLVITDGHHRYYEALHRGDKTINVKLDTEFKDNINDLYNQVHNKGIASDQAGSLNIGEIGHSIRQAVKKFGKPLDQSGTLGAGEMAGDAKKLVGGKQSKELAGEAAPTKLPGEQAGGISSTKGTPKMSIPEDAPTSGMRQRGLSSTIMDDPNTPAQVKQGIGELYKVRNTKDLQSRAANLVKDDPNLAMRVFKSDSNSDVGTMIGGELSAHLSRTGQHEAALEVAQTMSREATNRGQANQALSAWGKLAPESILRFAQSTVNEYNKTANLTGTANELKLSPDQIQKITGMSEDLQKMAPGHDKDIATKQLLNQVKQIVPASWVQKLSTVQTIGQLLNPKTLIRNIGGNTMFSGLENASQVLAAGIDKGLSAARGSERTVALPNLKTQAKGFVAGGKAQYAETAKGVNLGPDTQFDLADVPAFRDGVMSKIEKTMGIALRVPDRAAFQAAYDDTVQGLMKANKLDKPTQAILDQAEATGLYRTFQDNSKAARLFAGLKKSLNNVGFEGKDGKQWGLGDLILKYPKTPGNILARGIDYSPAGIVKGIAQVGIHAAQGKPFDQAAFANSIARGTVGTGALVGTGAVLGSLGIITEKPSQDTDTRNLQKASGQGGYQINTSALKRFIASGFKKSSTNLRQGDTLVSYDWAQPASIPLSAGAALGKGKSGIDGATSTLENASSGLNSLVEQPLVTGVNTFANNIKNKGIIGAFGESAKGAPASFVPTASNQARQLTDNNTRNTYDPNGARQSLNMVLNKIPGLDRSLPNKVGPLGENLQNYQNGSNNIFNVALNPAFVTKYQPNGSANLPLDILQRSGNTKQIPTTTKTSQNVNGTNVKLTASQNHDFQQFVGDQTKQLIDQRLTDPTFMALDDQAKADDISKQISSIQAAARAKLLGDTPSKSQAKAVDKVLTGNLVYTPKGSRSTSGTPPVPKNPHPMPKTISTTYDDKTKTWTQTSSKTGRVTKISADGTRTVINPGTTAKKTGTKRASSGGRKSSGNSPTAALASYTKHSSSNTAKYENSLRSLVARTLKAPKVKGTSSKTAKAKKYKAPSVKIATNPRPRKAFA